MTIFSDWPHTLGAVALTLLGFVLAFLFGGWSL